ncbi:MAG: ECF transporter S component [Clostridia bacterium]|nr:ECF transporter S component [Clostridia bacterium]
MKTDLPVRKLTMTGVMAALIAALTIFPHIPNMAGGYVHLGDGLIMLGVMLLGPLSIPAAAIGSMIADLLTYPPYAVATLIVKGLMALVAHLIYRRGNRRSMLPAFILSELTMVAGYFVYEIFLLGIGGAIADIPGNLIQGAAGVAIGYALSAIVPRLERGLR